MLFIFYTKKFIGIILNDLALLTLLKDLFHLLFCYFFSVKSNIFTIKHLRSTTIVYVHRYQTTSKTIK